MAQQKLRSRKFDVIIADPPYNIGKDFGNDSDQQPLGAYLEWTDRWIAICKELLEKNGLLYVYGFPEILARIAARHSMDRQRWLVWHYTNKTVPGMQFWQRSHESILCLWNGKRPTLEVDQIREGYSESFRKAIGKTRKNTRGRYSRSGTETIYNGHANGALPRDVLKIPALAGGAGRRERWFVCRTCNHRIHPPDRLAEHENHDVFKHPTQKPMTLTRRLLLSVIAIGKSRGGAARALRRVRLGMRGGAVARHRLRGSGAQP